MSGLRVATEAVVGCSYSCGLGVTLVQPSWEVRMHGGIPFSLLIIQAMRLWSFSGGRCSTMIQLCCWTSWAGVRLVVLKNAFRPSSFENLESVPAQTQHLSGGVGSSCGWQHTKIETRTNPTLVMLHKVEVLQHARNIACVRGMVHNHLTTTREVCMGGSQDLNNMAVDACMVSERMRRAAQCTNSIEPQALCTAMPFISGLHSSSGASGHSGDPNRPV